MVLAAIDSYFEVLSHSADLPVGETYADQVKVLAYFVLTQVAGWIQWAAIRGVWLRHVYAVSLGVFFALVMYGPGGLVNFAMTSLTVYLLLHIVPRRNIGLFVFLFSFAYLSYVHIYRMMTDWMGWKQDASTLQMILTCKMISLAFNYQDGMEKDLEEEQKRLAVKEIPDILEYYSYLTFYAGFVLGPVFEYRDYIRFVKQEDEFKSIPSPFSRSLFLFLQALVCVAAFKYLLSNWHYSAVSTAEWALNPYWFKFVYYNLAMVGCKFRYYSAFKFSESGVVASGLGYKGTRPDKSDDWDRVRGIVIHKAELGETTKVMIDNWNISVALWLRRYVFMRVASKQAPRWRKSSAQHITMAVSAFWHGFYPSYFVMFFFFSLLSEVSKMAYTTDFSKVPGVFKWVAWLGMYTCGNLHGVVFMQLGLPETLALLNALYWGPYIVLMLVWAFFKVTGIHRAKTKRQ